MYKKKNQLPELLLCIVDALVMLICLWAAGMLRYYPDLGTFRRMENFQELCAMMLISHVAVYYILKVYSGFTRRNRYNELAVSIKYNIALVACTFLLGFGLKRDVFVARMFMGFFLILNTAAVWGVHCLIRNRNRILKSERQSDRNLLVVTTGKYLPEICERFGASKEYAWKIKGVILLDGEGENTAEASGILVISEDPDEYLEFATKNVIDEVFIRISDIQDREDFLKEMVFEFEQMGIVVNLNLDLFNLGARGEKRIYTLEDYNVVAFASRLFDYRMVLVKRLIDIVGGLVGMVVTVIVGAILAPFLKLESKGPLIFKQPRVGVNGRIFMFYKFRSMYVDAEERKKELLEQNEMNGPMFKIEKDPRITKVGAFIRKTSIDELPQFWNVLKGDMSLVGTRPPTLDEYRQYRYYQKRRISFRPGITGLWQVAGRSDITDFDEVVKLDLEYIDNWSLMLDFKIICRTFGVVLGRKGAR